MTDWNGFAWITADDADNSVYTFVAAQRRSLGDTVCRIVDPQPDSPIPLPAIASAFRRPAAYRDRAEFR